MRGIDWAVARLLFSIPCMRGPPGKCRDFRSTPTCSGTPGLGVGVGLSPPSWTPFLWHCPQSLRGQACLGTWLGVASQFRKGNRVRTPAPAENLEQPSYRGMVLLAYRDVKSQARVPRPEAPSKRGCSGRGRRVDAPITREPFLHLAALRRPPSSPARGPGIFCLRLGTPGPTAARINDPPATPDPNSKDTGRRTLKEAQAAMLGGRGEENHIYRIGISLNGALS